MKLGYITITILSMMGILGSACNKLVEIPSSKSQIESTLVFADSSTATAALLGAYHLLGTASSSVYPAMKNIALYSDEYSFTTVNTDINAYQQSQVSPTNNANSGLWNNFYAVIYRCNAVIEGTAASTGLSSLAKKQLQGEARFLRAFAYFYLLNLYGKIPLILSTNVNENSRALQSDSQTIYGRITEDLTYAKSVLSTSYIGQGKVRANRYAAAALLARTWLYQGNWTEAAKEADEVIASGLYLPLSMPENAFLAGSKEAILQFWNETGVVADATAIIPASTNLLPQYVLTGALLQSFEAGDRRKTAWTATNTVNVAGTSTPYTYPAKYRNRAAGASTTEYASGIRLSEVLLIRAEARANTGNIAGAMSDINLVRTRAGLSALASQQTVPVAMSAIMKERRIELFGEWGHRFLDLRRSGNLDATLSGLKTTWIPGTSSLLPIPLTELNYNPNLIQNHGY